MNRCAWRYNVFTVRGVLSHFLWCRRPAHTNDEIEIAIIDSENIVAQSSHVLDSRESTTSHPGVIVTQRLHAAPPLTHRFDLIVDRQYAL